jgi:hypothetical protein
LKHSLKYVKNEIRKRGGSLISDEYINNKVAIFIRCFRNHIWRTRFNSIASGHWCPVCASNSYTFEEVKRAILKKKGKLLSASYKNTKTRLQVQCLGCACVWEPTFGNVLKGRWCPRCSGGKSQKRLFKILKEIYSDCKIKTNYKNFDWLKNNKTGGVQEIDIFVYNKDRSFTLAVEYDGEHHFYPVRFGGISIERAAEKFKKTKIRDKRKNKLIRTHPQDVKYFIRVKYITDLKKENIIYELKKKGIPTKMEIKSKI